MSSLDEKRRRLGIIPPVPATPNDVFQNTVQTETQDVSAPNNVASTTDYTWDTAKQDKELLSTIRRYAKNVDNQDFSSDEKAFEWFVGDRRWKDSNTFSLAKELNYVKGGFGTKYAEPQDLADLALIRERWEKLPGGFSRIADGDILGGLGAIGENIGKGMLDPTILFGGLAGKAVGSMVNRSAQMATRLSLKRALQTGTAISTDAALTGGFNLEYQAVNKEVGLQEEIDGWEALKAGALGAVLSTPGSLGMFKPKKLEKVDPVLAAEQAMSAATSEAGSKLKASGKGIYQGQKLTKEDAQAAKGIDPEAAEKSADANTPVDDVGLTMDNLNLASAIANTFPGLSLKKDFFQWWGKNNKRVLNSFKAKNFPDVQDEIDFDRMMKSFYKEDWFQELEQLERRGRVTDKQANTEARDMLKGTTPEGAAQALVNTPHGYAANVSETLAARYTINYLRDEVTATAKRLLNDPNPLSTKEMDEIEKKWDLLGFSLAKYAGLRSEAGRALRLADAGPSDYNKFLKAGAKAANIVTGTARSRKEREALLRDLGKAMSMLDENDPLQLDLFIANLNANKAGVSDVFYEMYYNWGLLSNPSTQVINFIGNTVHGVIENTERLIAAGVHAEERKPVLYRFAGYGAALSDAFKVGWQTFKTELPSDPQTRMENMNHTAVGSWIKKKGEAWRKAGVGETGFVVGGRQLRLPGRMLLALDEFSKLLHQRAYIYEQGARAADAAGITDKQARKDFFQQYLADPGDDVLKGALEEARRLTYTDKLGPGLRGFQQFIDDLPGGRVIIPFVRTPAKIIQQAADMLSVPGMLSTSRTAADMAAGGALRTRAMARIGMGYSLLFAGAMTALNGDATGPTPADPGSRATFEADNRLPWSVRSGDHWIQMNRFDPVAIPFTVGVGLEKTFESFAASGTGAEREDQFLSTMAMFLSDALLDKSFFQGVENVVGAIMEPERRAETFTKGVVRSFVPAIAAGYARAVDPVVKAPQTFHEVIQDRIGFEQRTKVPNRVDKLGFDVMNEVPGSYNGEGGVLNFINRFINPFKATSGANNPITNELTELGIKLNPTRKKYKDVDLDSEQIYIYNKAEGKTMNDFLRYFHSLPQWKTIPPEVKRMMIEEAKEKSAEMAQVMLIGVYPELVRLGATDRSDIQKITAPTKSKIVESIKGPSFER